MKQASSKGARATLRDAWRDRTLQSPRGPARQDADFLPSALAIVEAPPHPLPRVIASTIVALVAVSVGWACLSHVDTYATAPGKVVPKGRVQVIQPEETSRVAGIYVTDGQHVERGDRLVDLDATETAAETQRLEANLSSARVEASRDQALLEAVDHWTSPRIDPALSLPPALRSTEQRVLDGTLADVRSNQAKLKADVDQARASLTEVAAEIGKLESTLPLEERKEADYGQLIQRGFVGKHDYYNEQQAVIQLRHDLTERRAKAVELRASQVAAEQKLAAYTTSQRRTWLDGLHDAQAKASDTEQELVKARRRDAVRHLTAPVTGTVEQLAVHTIGGVATSAQPLLTIVPDQGGLEVEAIVNNRDVGFVKPGQDAEIKIETFPFARYGLLHGTVRQVADDARQDEKLGLIFTSNVALASEAIIINERHIRLRPGMAVTVEIRTGRQRVLSYLLSPLIENANESFHER